MGAQPSPDPVMDAVIPETSQLTAPFASAVTLMRGMVQATLASLSTPIDSGSLRNIEDVLCIDAARVGERAAALDALHQHPSGTPDPEHGSGAPPEHDRAGPGGRP